MTVMMVGIWIVAAGCQNHISHDKSLVGYWKFDEGTGIKTLDSSPNKLLGELRGAKWTDNAVSGKALEFNGNSIVLVKHNPIFDDMPDGITVCAWVYRYPSGAWNTVASRQIAETWSEYFGLAVFKDKPLFSIDPDGSDYSNATANAKAPLNKWIHLAGTYDNRTYKLFVNGEKVAEKQQSKPLTPKDKNPILLGGNTNTNCKEWVDCFNGCIDEIRIYSRPLSEKEIHNIYSQK